MSNRSQTGVWTQGQPYTLWRGGPVATLAGVNDEYGLIPDGAVVVSGDAVLWAGSAGELPDCWSQGKEVVNLQGRLLTPGLVDCHTHLVYAGNRAEEFEQRLLGASYADIARAGGGINATVTATRAASRETLTVLARPRIDALNRQGVTTVEIKSGYGLNVETELRMLEAAGSLATEAVEVVPTFLGAHALPPEFKGRPDAYIDEVCTVMIPELVARRLAGAVDAFCEHIGFDVAQTERVLECARNHGLDVKLHAEQLSDLGGAALAARYGARSADHLEYVSEASVIAMAQAGTVAVLLPGAFYFLGETTRPPVDLFRKHEVPMAIATDANPGSAPVAAPLLMLNMACILFGLTPAEALCGMTRVAAQALGIDHRVGTIQAGMQADFALWNVHAPGELAYTIGGDPCCAVVKKGRVVSGSLP